MKTKKERYDAVVNAMQRKTRDNGEQFYCFSDEAPKELHDIFLDNFEVRDIDYAIFNDACSVIESLEMEEIEDEDSTSEIEEASVYTNERLSYLDAGNQNEITDILNDYGCEDIATACAIWYDNEVRRAYEILRAYIIGDDNKTTD